MKSIHVDRLLDELGLDKKVIGEQLFADRTHPMLAMNKILRGETQLREKDIVLLSELVGLPIQELFSESGWSGGCKRGHFVISNGSFTAKLDTETMTSTVFMDNTVLYTEVLHSRSITVPDYVASVNLIVEKYIKDAE